MSLSEYVTIHIVLKLFKLMKCILAGVEKDYQHQTVNYSNVFKE